MLYNESAETLAQVMQRCGKCPTPGNIQGQGGLSFEQPDVAEDSPVQCGGVGLDDL